LRARPGRLLTPAIVVLLFAAAAADAATPDLFQETGQTGSFRLRPDATIVRQRPIKVDLAVLRGPSNTQFRVKLFDGDSVLVQKDRQETPRPKAFVWHGHAADQPGTTVVLANFDDALAGSLWVSMHGRIELYDIRYLGRNVHVLRKLRSMPLFPDGPPAPPGRLFDTAPRECSDPPDRIDALVLYTDDVLRNSASVSAIESEIEDAVALTNDSYANSGITQRLRLVQTRKIDYAETRDPEKDRDRLQNPNDGFLDEAQNLRNASGADAVILLEERIDGACGLTYMMEDASPQFADSAYAVVRRSCAADYLSFPHELGHIMGAHHDRTMDRTPNAEGYNFGFVKRKPTAPGDPWYSIMAGYKECQRAPAVDCVRIPYWSNPQKSAPPVYGGDAMGDANSADNHRRLNDTAKTVANFRCSSPTGGDNP